MDFSQKVELMSSLVFLTCQRKNLNKKKKKRSHRVCHHRINYITEPGRSKRFGGGGLN